MSNSLVSICIPAYKQIEYLKKCLESVLIQNYTNYELIITDDTPDDTVEVFIKDFLKNKIYHYFHNKPALGSPSNWNKAISLAKGSYIKIMHHDDCFYNADSLGEFVKALDDNTKAVLAFSNTEVVNKNTGECRIHSATKNQLNKLTHDSSTLFLQNFIGAPSAIIYRKCNLEFDINLKWLVDIDFYIQLLKLNANYIQINQTLIQTTDGAEHQVTAECVNNPNIELKENCYVFNKLTISLKSNQLFKKHFSDLFLRFDIKNINELSKYAPDAINNEVNYKFVFVNLQSYQNKKNRLKHMKSMIKNSFTIAIYKGLKDFKAKKRVKKQLIEFKKSAKNTESRFALNDEDANYCTDDNTINTGFDRHYLYHLAWAARVVKEINPSVHSDISSLLFFPTILSAFVKVDFYDYRPAQLNLDNLLSDKCDLMQLHFETNSIESLSCMHTVEHIGLGRYGDKIDYNGDLKAMNELKRVVKIGGNLLFVVPIGKARIQYNAHRVYSYQQILSYFNNEFTLKEFSLIPDTAVQGGLIRNATEEQSNMQNYGCGCFWFVKK